MTYPELLKELYSMAKSQVTDMGLARMQRLVHELEIPLETLKVVHVAGTNGKGSVSTKIASALSLSGYTTALYTSPHISSFRERFQINGQCIGEELLCRLVEHVLDIARKNSLKPTFFEVATLVMLLWCCESQVDFAVLETGLGGRLDATNVCHPVLTLITSIDFDHMDLLGDTLEKIAYEKAGIIKPNCPVVIGRSVPQEVIRPIAQTVQAPVYVCTAHSSDFEKENQELARMGLHVLKDRFILSQHAIDQGLQKVPPFRYQKLKSQNPVIIIDAAHNPHGVKALLHRYRQKYSLPPVVLLSCSKDKDLAEIATLVKSTSAHVFLTSARSPRAASVCELGRYFSSANSTKIDCIHKAVQEAVEHARKIGAPLLIFGSFYSIADIQESLGLKCERDPELIEGVWNFSKT